MDLHRPVGSGAPTSPGVVGLYLRRLKELQPVVALEAGTHSNWIYDFVKELGFEKVIMADARMLKVIFHSDFDSYAAAGTISCLLKRGNAKSKRKNLRLLGLGMLAARA